MTVTNANAVNAVTCVTKFTNVLGPESAESI
jgi:hypothetical protein